MCGPLSEVQVVTTEHSSFRCRSEELKHLRDRRLLRRRGRDRRLRSRRHCDREMKVQTRLSLAENS